MPSQDQAATVRAIAKSGEPDRYLTALLAKPDQQDALIALAAFGSDLARIPRAARDPMMQRIRLQWWRDALQAACTGDVQSGHPVADALATAIRSYDLPLDPIERAIDACGEAAEAAVDGNAEHDVNPQEVTSTVLFQLAALVCGASPSPSLQQMAADAGKAYSNARALLQQRQEPDRNHSADGPHAEPSSVSDQMPLAGNVVSGHETCLHHLNRARAGIMTLPRPQRLAFLPLAVVEPYLRLAQKGALTDADTDIGPLSRIWRIWWAYCTARP